MYIESMKCWISNIFRLKALKFMNKIGRVWWRNKNGENRDWNFKTEKDLHNSTSHWMFSYSLCTSIIGNKFSIWNNTTKEIFVIIVSIHKQQYILLYFLFFVIHYLRFHKENSKLADTKYFSKVSTSRRS